MERGPAGKKAAGGEGQTQAARSKRRGGREAGTAQKRCGRGGGIRKQQEAIEVRDAKKVRLERELRGGGGQREAAGR